jgi:growth hormone-inducible transmembrane protein
VISILALKMGQFLVAGASILGLGSLAYYGLGLSKQSGILDRASVWPQYVRDRIRSTYSYFGASLGITAASAWAVARSPTIMNLVMRNSMLVSVLLQSKIFFSFD